MKLDNTVLDNLIEQAKQNPRTRQNMDLRTTPEDNSQRMLNAMEPDTIVPIHRHKHSSEVLAVIRGRICQNFYDVTLNEQGERVATLTESLEIAAGDSCSICIVPKGAWHKAESLETGTIIFEAKDGAYAPLAPDEII